jgi:hypothetical protein
MEWQGKAWHGMERKDMEWKDMTWQGKAWHGMENEGKA